MIWNPFIFFLRRNPSRADQTTIKQIHKPSFQEKVLQVRQETLNILKSTAATPPNNIEIMDKVKRAALLFENEGPYCFPQFRGSKSQFLDHGTYIYILRMDGVLFFHAIFPHLENTSVLHLTDSTGEYFIQKIIQSARHSQEGWCTYRWWPELGNVRKVSEKKIFFKKVLYGVRECVVCCGHHTT